MENLRHQLAIFQVRVEFYSKEALCIPMGEIETFGELLNSNPNAKLTFWKFWFLGSIPWERKTVTPASLWHHPGLVLIHAVGVETPQPELTEAV